MALCGFLKQSTAVTVVLGQFLDETDGKTAETALTLAQADIRLNKNNGAGAQKNDATSCTHDENGKYTCPLNTTDTGTLGMLTVAVNKSGALPVRQDYMVVPANVYDSLIGGSVDLKVDVDQIKTSSTAATNQGTAALTMQTATIDNTGFTATSTILETSTITEATADHYVGKVIVFTSGAVQYQATRITAYALNGGRGRFTYQALTEAPANGVTFIIV